MWQIPLDYITTLEKADIYRTIFSNKDHITRLKTILKKFFQKTINHVIKKSHLSSFLASLNNSVNYAIFIICVLNLWNIHILLSLKYQGYCYILYKNEHLQVFPVIWGNIKIFKSQNVLTSFIQYMLFQWDENHLQVPLRVRNPLRKICSTF